MVSESLLTGEFNGSYISLGVFFLEIQAPIFTNLESL